MFRIGYGEDTHIFVDGRPLIIGGVEIPYERGLLGHSDADVLCHALSDALLGACALGDIGHHFPDTDEKYKGAGSVKLLMHVYSLVKDNGFTLANADCTIIAQAPKMAPHINSMREKIATALNTDIGRISIKATTSEGMNAEGKGMCITVRAVVLLEEVSKA